MLSAVIKVMPLFAFGLLLQVALIMAATEQAEAAECSRVEPVHSLEVSSFYSDAKNSVPDADALRLRNDALAPLRMLRDQIVRAGDNASQWSAQDLCALSSLNDWASSHALEAPSTTGEAVYSKTRFVFAIAVALGKVSTSHPEIDVTAAKKWVLDLAKRNVEEFPKHQKAKNGLYFWTGAMALAVSALTEDHVLRSYGRRVWIDAVETIRPDGTLALAAARGQRALIYHVSALNSLIAMEILDRNCRSTSCLSAQELKLYETVVAALRDPTKMASLAGIAQEAVEPRSLSYLCRAIKAPEPGALDDVCGPRAVVDLLLGGEPSTIQSHRP